MVAKTCPRRVVAGVVADDYYLIIVYGYCVFGGTKFFTLAIEPCGSIFKYDRANTKHGSHVRDILEDKLLRFLQEF